MTKPFALVIEDDPKLGTVFKVALEQAGYEVALDADGSCFLQILAEKKADLILLDFHLPFAAGGEILTQIRADSRWVNIPVIIATADLFAARDFQGKVEHVLVKPVGVARLIDIATHLRTDT